MTLSELKPEERTCENCGCIACLRDLGRMHGLTLTPYPCGWFESAESKLARAEEQIAGLEEAARFSASEYAKSLGARDAEIAAIKKSLTLRDEGISAALDATTIDAMRTLLFACTVRPLPTFFREVLQGGANGTG